MEAPLSWSSDVSHGAYELTERQLKEAIFVRKATGRGLAMASGAHANFTRAVRGLVDRGFVTTRTVHTRFSGWFVVHSLTEDGKRIERVTMAPSIHLGAE